MKPEYVKNEVNDTRTLTDSVVLECCNIFLLFFSWIDGEMHNY